MEGCLHTERETLKGFDDSESENIDEDIEDLLPNDPFGMAISISLPNDPFGMGISISLPNDPFGMDINISLPNDPLGMDINLSLPKDPFGMDFIIGTGAASITGWIDDFGSRTRGLTHETSKAKMVDDDKLLAELNFVWSNSMEFESEVGDNKMVASVGSMLGNEDGSQHYMLGGNMEEFICFGHKRNWISGDATLEPNGQENDCSVNEGGAVADALFFALGYLGVRDLLSVERVCKSLREAVQNDPLLWRNVHIDRPLNGKVTDDDLMRLTNRAQGTLRSLNLVECIKITDTGLKRLLERNPGLTKLSVPGCIRLNVEGLLHNLKFFKSVGIPGIEHLRIGGLFGITNQHFKEFKVLVGADKDKQSRPYKPRFYGAGQLYLSLDDERTIDIETCPRCQQVRQVYDCPTESCQGKLNDVQSCRGCTFCIARCINCGCCLNNSDYEETFCFDLLCLECWAQLLSCQERVTFSPKHTCLHPQASYRFVLYG
ncbi:F-box protein SKIP14 [Forsythia ovata]|uniref:F-box protein SKIP14 n=1 Tax=Forsythia ovata TaxID=205694 RepID=A0ABD1TNQ6_9LAMI